MKKATKKDIYTAYGIEYKAGKILSPIGWICPLLINGNEKLGKGVYTLSILPTNKYFTVHINDETILVKGSCPCHCDGCYATRGNYRYQSAIESLGRKTFLCYYHMDFVERAIMAQIEADKIHILRIHAAGDFFGLEYLEMWKRIIKANPDTVFWTYTKMRDFENAFDEFENANIVSSIIPGYGFNFGKCAYIMKVYHALKAAGIPVYICRCGIDKNQHCTNCKSCSENKFVLFLEHATGYKPEKDPLFPEFIALVENQ